MLKRILVVDDHPMVALALKVVFRRDGRFAVTADARTAADGLERIDGHDAVLLDLHLPDLGGPELVRAFRARAPETPLIVHSAAGDVPAVDAVRDLVDDVVLKSEVPELLAALARATGAP